MILPPAISISPEELARMRKQDEERAIKHKKARALMEALGIQCDHGIAADHIPPKSMLAISMIYSWMNKNLKTLSINLN